jgi:hypothetical protein
MIMKRIVVSSLWILCGSRLGLGALPVRRTGDDGIDISAIDPFADAAQTTQGRRTVVEGGPGPRDVM